MRKNTLWYGYLEAGPKSTPVVMDPQLPTGNTETVYLFNLARGEILEYRRQIVEPKLQELQPDQTITIKQLKTAYSQVRHNFRSRNSRILHFPQPDPADKKGLASREDDETLGVIETDSKERFKEEARFNENS